MALTSLTPDISEKFQSLLPADRFRSSAPSYLEEPRGRWAGQKTLVALPRDTEEVAALVRAAGEMGVGIVPYGGGTGLVGGQVKADGALPLILSLEKMNRIHEVLPEENVLVADAGVILAEVQAAAEAVGRLFPLSLASEGSARIGGLLATNAGGTGVLRYGNARDLCLGLEAVLPDGEIYRGLTRLRKDNSGYDLRHLLIGAEGTLGVITAAALKLSPLPRQYGAALMAVGGPADALSLLAVARDVAGEAVSAFELIHRQGFDFLAETGVPVRNPWEVLPEWCVLIDLGLAAEGAPDAMLERIFEMGVEKGLVSDGLIARSEGQRADFWAVRERIPEANRLVGSVSSHDVSVPLGALPAFIEQGWQKVRELGPYRVNCFGHMGDGNMHFNVFPPMGESAMAFRDQRQVIKRTLHDLVDEMGGSVSAEHGVGRLKVDDLERYADPAKLAVMRSVKAALDPKGIMNPGAVLRE